MAEDDENKNGRSSSDLPESSNSKTSQIARGLAASNAAMKALEAASLPTGFAALAKNQSALQDVISRSSEFSRALSTPNAAIKALEAASLPSGFAAYLKNQSALENVFSKTSGFSRAPSASHYETMMGSHLTPASLRSLSASLPRRRDDQSPLVAEPSDVSINSASELGSLIRDARRRMGLSQQSFADLAGVGRRFISELENGKSSVEFDKVLRAAEAAGIGLVAKAGR